MVGVITNPTTIYPTVQKLLIVVGDNTNQRRKVNPSNWENDQLLSRKLGFTEADLEDFLLFISKPEHEELNYKETYLAYMKEIDSLQ